MIFAATYTELLLIWSTVFLGLVTAQVLVSLGQIKRADVVKVAPVGFCVVFAVLFGLFL